YLAGRSFRTTIGGLTFGGAADDRTRNVISANGTNGIEIVNSSLNTIAGNFIGTDVTGTKALANKSSGVNVIGKFSNSNTIGAAAPTAKGVIQKPANLISGNGGSGITTNRLPDLLIVGNFIGTDINGTTALPNGSDGISVVTSKGIRIGTGAAGDTNL